MATITSIVPPNVYAYTTDTTGKMNSVAVPANVSTAISTILTWCSTNNITLINIQDTLVTP